MSSKADALRELREKQFANRVVRDAATSVRDKPSAVRDIPKAVRDATRPASLAADPQPAMTDAERQAKYRSAHLDEVRQRERDRKRAERRG